MSALRSAAADYLAIRRAVGFKLRRAEGLLFSFVEFLEAERATRVTTQLALRWATLPAGAGPGWQDSRLCVARGFARHMSALDPATEAARRPAGAAGTGELPGRAISVLGGRGHRPHSGSAIDPVPVRGSHL